MKAIRTLALVTGLLALSGVSQAQFSSTWTAVSDYDFRGVSQSGKSPALQASADYTFGETGFSMGAWASNIDFGKGNDEDLETDFYFNYAHKVNETFTLNAGGTWYEYPLGNDADGYPEIYVGLTAGNFNIKQWYSWMYGGGDNHELYTEMNYTQPLGDKFSLAFHAGYVYGDAFRDIEAVDYAVQLNYTAGNFQIFGKFTGTDASGAAKVTDDVFNNEPRFLIGVQTTLPWAKK